MFDVAIVGGGPAGCAAALALRRAGLSVVVISTRRERDRPTETCVPRLRALLGSLGALEALAACEPCYGIESTWGQPGPVLQSSITNPQGHAWFIHRQRFDAILGECARAAGAEWLPAAVEHLDFAADRVTLRTPRGTVCATSAILATGSPRWAAQATRQRLVPVDTMACYWSRLPASSEPRLLQVETTPEGWWYVCPGEAGAMIACFVTDGENARTLQPRHPQKWHELFRATNLGRQRAMRAAPQQVEVVPVCVEYLAHQRGPGWFAIGDAAIKLDPIASSGTATALETGLRAARCLANDEAAARAQTDSLERWSAGLIAQFLRQRAQAYAAQAAREPGGFWHRRAYRQSQGGLLNEEPAIGNR